MMAHSENLRNAEKQLEEMVRVLDTASREGRRIDQVFRLLRDGDRQAVQLTK